MSKRSLQITALVGVLVTSLLTARPAAAQYEDVVERAKPAVVLVAGKRAKDWSVGSGFFVDSRGYIVTARHVIADTKRLVVFTSTGRQLEATVERTSTNFDAAILKVQGSGFTALRLGDSSKIRVGQEIIALGYPLPDVGQQPALIVTRGIISAVRAAEGLLQIDAALNSGNSGGPVLNREGEAIGIAKSSIKKAQAFNFALAIDLVKTLTAGLIQEPGAAQPSQPPSVQAPRSPAQPAIQAPGTPSAQPPAIQAPGALPALPAPQAPGTPPTQLPIPTPDVVVSPDLIRPGSGIGLINLGMTVQQAVLTMGRPFDRSGISDKGEFWWRWFASGPTFRLTPELTVWARNAYGPIIEIRITSSSFATLRGNRVGSLLEGFKTEFGHEYRVQNNLYLDLPVLRWPGMYVGFDPTTNAQERRVVYIGVF